MTPPPLVSVLIPIYNHADYVVASLESVVRQDHPRIELIALDDGSIDASLATARGWLETHGHRFERWSLETQPNAGVAPTLNRLIRASSGEFIYPLASDDLIADGGISGLLAHASRYAEPTLLFFDVRLIGEDGSPWQGKATQLLRRRQDWLAASPAYLATQLLFDWGTPFQHQFYSRALYDALGGYDENVDIEDLPFALRAAAQGRIAYAPLVAKHYRMRASQRETPGVSRLEWSGVPAYRSVRSAFGWFGRTAIDLQMHARDPGSLARTPIRALLKLMHWFEVTRLQITGNLPLRSAAARAHANR